MDKNHTIPADQISFLPSIEMITGTYVSSDLKKIAEKVLSHQRISMEEGLLLFEQASLGFAGTLANFVNYRKSKGKVFFNRNFHLEPTNKCVYSCSFCSYSRLIKDREDAWELSQDQILEKIKLWDNKSVSEIHITGGVIPHQDLKFYSELFQKIKSHRPALHIKALTPVEFHYMFKKAKVSYQEGLKILHEAGLDSLPGGGAEIFHSEIRDLIAGGKCSAEEWLSIHEIWHSMGLKSNATMLYGHIEKYLHRVDHLERLRSLQDKTGGFNAFIPLKFRNKNNEMSHISESSIIEDLRNYAISRVFLDNFDHLKTYWAMIGRNTSKMALSFGADDMDGTIDDTTKIYSMAGSEESHPELTTEQLVEIIQRAGRIPVERDTLYKELRTFNLPETSALKN